MMNEAQKQANKIRSSRVYKYKSYKKSRHKRANRRALIRYWDLEKKLFT